MAMNMSNLLKLSSTVQKLTLASRNTVIPIRLLRTSCYCKATHLKDSEAQTFTSQWNQPAAPKKTKSRLMSEIETSGTQSHVCQLIKEHGKSMNAMEAFKALEALFSLDKGKSEEISSISTTKEFALLCDILKRRLRDISFENIIKTLEILNYFHVPTSIHIIRDILEIIRSSMNDLSVEQMLYLDSTLSKCQKTPLVKALSIALPMVLQSHIKSHMKSQIDMENVDTLVSLLRACNLTGLGKDSRSSILTALNRIDESLFNVKHAKTVMSIIAHSKNDDLSTDVLRKCQKILIDWIDDMKSKDLVEIVEIISVAIDHGNVSFYNDSLLDACIMTTISRNLGLDTAINILAFMNKLCHASNSLLDYIAAKCFEDPNFGRKICITRASPIISGMSIADYKPVFWGALEECVLTRELFNLSPRKLLRVGIHLAAIDCYSPELLARIFEYSNSPEMSAHSRGDLFLLYNAVKSFYPKYDGPWPQDSLLQECQTNPIVRKTSFPLKSAVESALGGPQYVLTDLRPVQGYNFDHVVMMRKGGFPIALNNPDEPILSNVEDLKPPENSQVILFSYIPKYGCAVNTQRLTGNWSLMMRVLKLQTNYTIIPIKHNTWTNLTELERVQYISQAIRLKCDELSLVFNT